MSLFNTIAVFFSQPIHLTVLIVSWTLALVAFLYWKERHRSSLLYAHLFFALMPLFYFAVAVPCNISLIQGLLALCSVTITKLLIYLIPAGIVGALLSGSYVVPLVYKKCYNAKEINNKKISRMAGQAGISQPKIFVLDTAKPIAFSHGKSIFVSVGMHELLSQKETEAVLLHELGHIKNRSSAKKFSALLARLVSPLAFFYPLGRHIAREEKRADDFAVRAQKTRQHLRSAKTKVAEFFSHCQSLNTDLRTACSYGRTNHSQVGVAQRGKV